LVSELHIRCLTTGRVRGKRRTGPLRYLPGGWSDETLPVHAFAVDHPDGVCLFDTGQTERASRGGYHPRWHPYLRLARFELTPEDEVVSQLDPVAVRWVVLSHLHTDHGGGLSAFTHAEVLVSRIEWERAAGVGGRLRGYLPQHWPTGLTPRLVDFSGPAAGPFAASHDVADDGRLLMVPLPGHTPGHAGLLVDGETLLAGDATWSGGGLRVLQAHDPGLSPG
jgi:glyoxylase-like metal-dependent hydrolase (beta-lactamase superfamily II)